MSKKEKFINCIDEAFFSKVDLSELDPDIVAYWEAFKGKTETEKPLFTDNGKLILKYLQDNPDITSAKAKSGVSMEAFLNSLTSASSVFNINEPLFLNNIICNLSLLFKS